MSPRWRRRLIIVLILTAAFLLGSNAQEQLGISLSLEGLEQFRRWVQQSGWWAPAVYITLVIFRLFIGLSSHIVLYSVAWPSALPAAYSGAAWASWPRGWCCITWPSNWDQIG